MEAEGDGERTVTEGIREAVGWPVALSSVEALDGAEGVGEALREAVEECERMVTVPGVEAETLGQAVWEAVGDRERTVSEAAGEGVPALGLGVPRLLPVPPGASEAVGRVVGGIKVKEGVKEAVEVCERMVTVAGTEAETVGQAEMVAVEDCERAVAVAAAEIVPASGLPVPRLLLVGVKEALGEVMLVPVWEGLSEALTLTEAVARMVGGMKVSVGDTVGVCVRKVSVGATEVETLGQAVWEAVGDWERTVSEAAGEAVPAAGLVVACALPVPGSPVELTRALGEAGAVADTLTDVEALAKGERVAVVERERRVSVARGEAEMLRVAGGEAEPLVEAN